MNRMAADNKTGLMALGSAAVMGVYAAGWFKTQAAAERFAAEAAERRPPAPSLTKQPQLQTVQRIAPTAQVGSRTRLRAGATASAPPIPALQRSSDSTVPAMQQLPTTAQITTSTPVQTAPSPAVTVDVSPAPTPVVAPMPAPAPQSIAERAPARQAEVAAPKWKDGTYYGWGTSRHGDIQAAVIIKDGRIANALISQCLTQYSCSWIVALPPQVVGRQSAEVDYVSGATQSTNAFYYAVMQALTHAK